MPEYNMVSNIDSVIENALQIMFEDLDEVASKWAADSHNMLEQLAWSLNDFDLLSEYRSHIADVWEDDA